MEEHKFIKRIDNEIDSIVSDRDNLTSEEIGRLSRYSSLFNTLSKISAFIAGLCALTDFLLAKNFIKNINSDTIWQEIFRVLGFDLSTAVGVFGVILRYVSKESKKYIDDVIDKGNLCKRGK